MKRSTFLDNTMRTLLVLGICLLLCLTSDLAAADPDEPTVNVQTGDSDLRLTADHAALGVKNGIPRGLPLHVNVQMLDAPPEIDDFKEGEVMWERNYRILDGEEITLAYRDEDSDIVNTIDLLITVPTETKAPGHKVTIQTSWSSTAPDDEPHTVNLGIDGEMGAVIFNNPRNGHRIYLRITPRILWGDVSDTPLMRIRNAYLIVNDRVIARDIDLMTSDLILRDDRGEIMRLSCTMGENSPRTRGRISGNTLRIEAAGLALELVGSKPICPGDARDVYLTAKPSRVNNQIDLGSLSVIGVQR
ncbi:MAG: hypothetical protein GY835_13810 [bacterium]|nr:hypothetical protein [bacterium]